MDPSPSLSAGTRNWKNSPQRCSPHLPRALLTHEARCGCRSLPSPALPRRGAELPDPPTPLPRTAPTLSSTTSVIWGSPSGFCMLAKMNWKPNRNSRSYRFFSSGFNGFHCSAAGRKRRS